MLLLDTSVWIEFLRTHEPFYGQVHLLLTNDEVLGLPWVFGELLQGARNSYETKRILEFWEAIPKPELSLCEKVWIRAGTESRRQEWFTKGVGLIDAAIICAAAEYSSKVWTLDAKLASVLRFKRMLYEA